MEREARHALKGATRVCLGSHRQRVKRTEVTLDAISRVTRRNAAIVDPRGDANERCNMTFERSHVGIESGLGNPRNGITGH